MNHSNKFNQFVRPKKNLFSTYEPLDNYESRYAAVAHLKRQVDDSLTNVPQQNVGSQYLVGLQQNTQNIQSNRTENQVSASPASFH